MVGPKKKKLSQECPCPVTQSCPALSTQWTIRHKAPLSMKFFSQEYWSGLPFLFPRDLPNPRIELHWQADSLPVYHLGRPTQEQDLINILHANLHFKVSFLENPFLIHQTHAHTHTHTHTHIRTHTQCSMTSDYPQLRKLWASLEA